MLWKKRWVACVAGLCFAAPSQAQSPAADAKPVIPEACARANWSFGGGAGFYLLQPYATNNLAYSITTSTTQNAGSTITGLTQPQQFGWSMQPAFDVWLEAVSPSGIGLRARYFHLDGGSNDLFLNVPSTQYNSANGTSVIAVTPTPYLFNSPPGTVPQQNPALAGLFGGPSPFVVNFPGAPTSVDRFTFTSYLRLDAVDLEATGSYQSTMLTLSGGIGGRYFHMSQDYNASLINSDGLGASLTESLQSSRTFQGGGPTISGQISWHPILPNLSLYAAGRCSLVVGQTTQTTTGDRTLNDPTGAFNPIGAPTSTSNSFRIPSSTADTIPITELELGMEYAVFLKSSVLSFRGAVVDQTYFGAGNASRQDGNLSLLGFKVSGGIRY